MSLWFPRAGVAAWWSQPIRAQYLDGTRPVRVLHSTWGCLAGGHPARGLRTYCWSGRESSVGPGGGRGVHLLGHHGVPGARPGGLHRQAGAGRRGRHRDVTQNLLGEINSEASVVSHYHGQTVNTDNTNRQLTDRLGFTQHLIFWVTTVTEERQRVQLWSTSNVGTNDIKDN